MNLPTSPPPTRSVISGLSGWLRTRILRHLRRLPVWGIVLIVGFLHGLLYLYLVPPWQHYDEPNHFEYAWLVANGDRWPTPGEADIGMRQAVYRSMWENDFFGKGQTPPALAADEVPQISLYSQLDEPPLYYLLVSLPLRLLRSADVVFQLYAARWLSLLLYLVSLLAVWGATHELTGFPGGNLVGQGDHPLRWMAPLGLALLPGFTDSMTAVNNDAAAVAVMTLFFWGSLRLVRHGFSWLNLLWAALAAVLSYFTKNTALIAIPLFFLALLFALFRGRWSWLVWGGLGVGAVGLLACVVGWGDAALWARDSEQPALTRQENTQAPSGSHVFSLQLTSSDPAPGEVQLQQLLPPEISQRLAGKQLTLGVWMWADRPLTARLPGFVAFPGDIYERQVMLTEAPAFFAFSFRPVGSLNRAWVRLAPFNSDAPLGATVFYDGLVLAEGRWPKEAPVFDNSEGSSGVWGERPFTNLLRNASAEAGWPRLRPWLDQAAARFFPDPGVNHPSVTLYTLLDTQGAGGYYAFATRLLNSSFWGRFGWGHVSLPWRYSYRLLGYLALLSLAAALVWGARSLRRLPWPALAILGLAALFLWGLTLVRGSNYMLQFRHVYYPVARHAYPVILPTWLLLSAGGLALLKVPEQWMHSPAWLKGVLYLGFLVCLALYALFSLVGYYA